MEQMAVQSLLRQAGWAVTKRIKAATIRRCLVSAIRQLGAEDAWRAVGLETRGLLNGLVTRIFLEADMNVGRLVLDGFDPVEDFTGVVYWDFELPCAHWLEQRILTGKGRRPPAHHEVVTFFEARRLRAERLTHGLLQRLARWLSEI